MNPKNKRRRLKIPGLFGLGASQHKHSGRYTSTDTVRHRKILRVELRLNKLVGHSALHDAR
jgi:hypothetical protein